MIHSVRALTPSDLPPLLAIHREAFSKSLGVRLGDGYLTAFLNWFIQSETAVVLGSFDKSTIAGYVFGAPNGYNPQLNRDLFNNILAAVITHPHLILRQDFLIQIPERLRNLVRRSSKPVLSSTDSSMFKLVGIGVKPSYQGNGIGYTLVSAFEEAVWMKGFNSIELTVYTNNAAARSLYEKCGWQSRPIDHTRLTYYRLGQDSAN